jgi:hypothetical protein
VPDPGVLVGCATRVGPTAAEPEAALLGPYPEKYEQIVRLWIEDDFRRVTRIDSLRVSAPLPGFSDGPLRPKTYGWWSRVNLRARDRLGAPTGTLTYDILIRDGQVIAWRKQAF